MSSGTANEIDLQRLAVNILRYFQRYFRFILVSTLLGIIVGLVYYFTSVRVFESQMIVMSDILTSSYSDRLTESLDRLIIEQNDTIIADRLTMSIDEIKSIKKIKIESVKREANVDKKDEASTFIITVRVSKPKLLPKLQEGIITYLRNNEFVKTRVRQREETYQQLIENVDKEVKSLDSLKARLFQGKPIYSNSSEIMLMDPTSIYSKILDLKRQKIDLRNALELFNSIQLIEGFTPFKKPVSPKLSISLLVGCVFGFFAAIGILTLKQLLKMAQESEAAA